MAGSERHDYYAPAPALHFFCAHDRVFRVVAAFYDNVGLQMRDEIEWRVLCKNYNEIDAFERRQQVRALGVAAHGSGRTLEAPYRFVAVDSNDERVGSCAGGGEDVDVPGMKQVEHAIRERYSTLIPSSPPLSLCPCRNLRRGISWLQGLLDTTGWKWMTRVLFIGSLMYSS